MTESSSSSTPTEMSPHGPPPDRELFASVLARRQRPRILPILSASCSCGGAVSLLLGPRSKTAILDVLVMTVRRWTSNSGKVCIFDSSLVFAMPEVTTDVSIYTTPSAASLLAALRDFHSQHLKRPTTTVTIGWMVILVDWTSLKVEFEPLGVLNLALRYLDQLAQSYDFPLVFTGLPMTLNGWIISDIKYPDPRPWVVPGPAVRQCLAQGRLWLRPA
ncbi:hypothetical protein Pmar_PMAR000472, partial [Perkinsus marinus ATCC 50983]